MIGHGQVVPVKLHVSSIMATLTRPAFNASNCFLVDLIYAFARPDMTDIIITTYDWVPEVPRGYVRDLRLRWALEEAQLPYRVESTPFHDRGPDHFAKHPFG
jgi:hypothetical protein